MVTIRLYCETDAEGIGKLITDTFSEFNLSFAPPAEREAFLGPFRHARSPEQAHQEAIARVIRSEMVFVAEEAGEIVVAPRLYLSFHAGRDKGSTCTKVGHPGVLGQLPEDIHVWVRGAPIVQNYGCAN